MRNGSLLRVMVCDSGAADTRLGLGRGPAQSRVNSEGPVGPVPPQHTAISFSYWTNVIIATVIYSA